VKLTTYLLLRSRLRIHGSDDTHTPHTSSWSGDILHGDILVYTPAGECSTQCEAVLNGEIGIAGLNRNV
jgi:hypothetical protein